MPPTLPIHIRSGPSGWILVELPYTEERLVRIKTLTGRTWNAEHKCWAIPRTAQTLDRLLALFSGDQVVVDPAVRKAPAKHPGQRPPLKLGPGSASEAVDVFQNVLQQNAYSRHTVNIYLLHVKRFFIKVEQTPQELEPETVLSYLQGLITQEDISASYQNQSVRALKSFLTLALHKTPEFLQEALPPRKKRWSE